MQFDHINARLLERSVKSKPEPRIEVRPFLNSDFKLQQEFFAQLSPADLHARFLTPRLVVSDPLLRFLSQVDQKSHVLLMATQSSANREQMLAEARLVKDPGAPGSAEFAVAVNRRVKGTGLAGSMLQVLEYRARSAGHSVIFGDCLWSNKAMLGLARKQGYCMRVHPRDGTLSRMTKCLAGVQTSHPGCAVGQDRIAA